MFRPLQIALLLLLLTALPVVSMGQGKDKETAKEPAADVENTDAEGVAGDEGAGDDDTPGEPEPDVEKEPSVDKEAYTVRLRDLEDRVNRLKEQIFRSKARLSLLAETVLDRKIAGAKSAIVFRNEMGGSYRLVKATFLLDGGPIFSKSDEAGTLAERERIDLFDGPVMPGEHILSVVLHYRGHGFGIFSYLKGYSFKVRSSYTFSVGEGKAVDLQVIGFEKGGVTTPIEERPAVRFKESLTDYSGPSSSSQEAKEASEK